MNWHLPDSIVELQLIEIQVGPMDHEDCVICDFIHDMH